MGQQTTIAWTDATFNPWRGCTKVSPGCAHCYAESMSRRNPKVLGVWGDDGVRVVASDAAWREPLKWDRAAGEAGERRRVFCASLADVFEDRPELVEPRARLWQTILYTTNLDWLLLTKRPANVLPALRAVWQHQKERRLHDDCLSAWIDGSHPPDNVWLGTSVEDQRRADERIPELLKIPARVRFLSVEPLLGPVHLRLTGIHWVIIGGESGPGARPCETSWIRSIVRQCREAGVPAFVKQMGSRAFCDPGELLADPVPAPAFMRGLAPMDLRDPKGGDPAEWPDDLRVREMPEVRPCPC